jgi:hypothetical protein
MATATEIPAMDGRLDVLRDQSRDLIEAEVAEMNVRGQMERAIRQSLQVGLSIDEISDATGLTPEEIRKIGETRSEPTLDEMLGFN